jgi:transcriptional regulator with XRE-family HTH domain
MKLSEYREKLAQNPEYVEAEKKLRIRFTLGNAVLRERIKKGWSQAELAEAVGTKQANISRIEACLANPTLDLIQRLCEILDLDFKLVSQGQMSIAETSMSDTSKQANTTTGILERVDNQPDNIFCPRYRISSVRSVQEGMLE